METKLIMQIKSLNDLSETSKYLKRINAEPRSLLKAVVTEQRGQYWLDVAIIKFEKNGDITAPAGFEPTEAEVERIKEEFNSIEWPSNVFINLADKNLPDLYKDSPAEDKFEFFDPNGNLLMLQVKKVKSGSKSYIPITKWSDGEYRFIEPDGLLPLFGLETIKDHSTVFIHEGGASARAGRMIAEGKMDHPWGEELSSAAHVGFVGGALSPLRTDWSILAKHGIVRAYIVADNDAPGRSAVPKIARELSCPTFLVQFTDQFPVSFDIADKMPDSFFSKIGEKKYYVGPTFRQVLHPATYMTKMIPMMVGEKIKEVPVLREHAKGQWIFAEETSLFVNSEFPDIIRSAEVLDNMLFPFSDTRKTSELILGAFVGRTPKFAYSPATKGRKIINNGMTAINLYIPPDTKPADGDATPWLEYLEYLIPKQEERYEVMKWCATLIAHPEKRMHYALLMISEQTGTGKSTLGEILAQLVGPHNASFPSEQEILEQFNSWLAKKRLVIVNEIYQGNSWKASNKLKSYVTDKTVTMRLMFKDGVTIDNYAHFLCCSNSLEALRLEDNDRRWYIPVITEEKRSQKDWAKFFEWLNGGGYSIIAGWAAKFGDYVEPGERAPMSNRKAQMINESRSAAEKEALELCESILSRGLEVALANNALFDWATFKIKGQVYDKPLTLQRLMKEEGFTILNNTDRMFHQGKLQPILVSPKLIERTSKMTKDEARDYIKSKIKAPNVIIDEGI